MSALDLTREWLQTVLRPYPAREKVLAEVLDILKTRRTLSVKTDAFTFDSGQTALLLLLHGTLPITFRGATYQIPIHMWIPYEYPRLPPLAFVVPTKEMGVRKGREVDPSGRVNEDAVGTWWAGWQEKSIEMLLRQLASVFSVTPPVYAKPPESSSTNGTSSPGPSRQTSNTAQSNGPPAPPARPQVFPDRIRQEALPQYPSNYGSPPQSPHSPPIPGRPFQPPRPQYQQSPATQNPTPPHRPYASQTPQPGPSYSPQSPHAQYAPAYPAGLTQPQPSPAVMPTLGLTAQPRAAHHDLLSSPNEATSNLPDSYTGPPQPPSKPPAPSLLHLHAILLPHLQATLPSIIHSLQSNRQHLQDRRDDLLSGEPAIRDEMARLEAVRKVCESVERKMSDSVRRGDERVVELEQRGEVEVDEVVCGISIVHNQLIDLVAEDNAIEDTIYHLTRALDTERIDLDRFIKSIRSLAREQYTKRALIERILQGMGQKQW